MTEDVCKTAIIKAAKHKHKRKPVQIVLEDIDNKAIELRRLILEEKYIPSPYKRCDIVDHPSGKARVLHKPKFFPDQCVHHVIILLLGNELLKRLDPHCIASIPKRGIHMGHKLLRKWLQKDVQGTRYCLKCDIKKCYDNIKPEVVVSAFAHFIKDKKFLRLIEKVAYSHASLPLGNFTSGWFQNLVMATMDRAVRADDGAKYLLRYVDDFVILSDSKEKLHNLVGVIGDALSKVGLWLKENWQVFEVDIRGIDMLGYRFYRHFVLLRKRCLQGLRHTIRVYKESPTPKLARSLLSRLGQCKWFNSFNFRQNNCLDIDLVRAKRRAIV